MIEYICKPNTVLYLTAISVRYTAEGELSVITKGVKIGDGCFVGAKNSIDKQDIPPYSITVGAPAHDNLRNEYKKPTFHLCDYLL
jgi:hypothetical protein